MITALKETGSGAVAGGGSPVLGQLVGLHVSADGTGAGVFSSGGWAGGAANISRNGTAIQVVGNGNVSYNCGARVLSASVILSAISNRSDTGAGFGLDISADAELPAAYDLANCYRVYVQPCSLGTNSGTWSVTKLTAGAPAPLHSSVVSQAFNSTTLPITLSLAFDPATGIVTATATGQTTLAHVDPGTPLAVGNLAGLRGYVSGGSLSLDDWTASVPATGVSPPTGPSQTTVGSTSFTATWTAASGGDTPTGYGVEVKRRSTSSAPAGTYAPAAGSPVGPSVTSLVVTDSTLNGQLVTFRVRTLSAGDPSAWAESAEFWMINESTGGGGTLPWDGAVATRTPASITGPSSGQFGTTAVFTVSDEDGAPCPGVQLFSTGGTFSGLTDALGQATLTVGLRAGSFTVYAL